MLNPGRFEASVQLKLVDNAGHETAQAGLVIAPGAHRAAFVAGPGQLFPPATAFRGALTVRSSSRLSRLPSARPACLSHTPLCRCAWWQRPVFAGPSPHRKRLIRQRELQDLVSDPESESNTGKRNLVSDEIGRHSSKHRPPGQRPGEQLRSEAQSQRLGLLQTDGSGPLTVGAASIHPTSVDAAGVFLAIRSPGALPNRGGS